MEGFIVRVNANNYEVYCGGNTYPCIARGKIKKNVDKLFAAFESAMDKNEYLEVGKIVKAIDDLIGNLKIVIKETISPYLGILYTTNIPHNGDCVVVLIALPLHRNR